MKRYVIFFLVVALTTAAISAANDDPTTMVQTSPTSIRLVSGVTGDPARDDPDDEIFFEEDFEDGDRVEEEWTTQDLSVVAFHKSDLLGAEDNLLWWCGDTLSQYDGEPVGYDNRWLQFLDTPVLDLTEAGDNLTLTFDAYWLLEDPRLVPPNDPYDGWDGWFVMISTDGGDEFETIIPETPEYTAERVSAAERVWNFDAPQPGWVFHSGEWGDTTGAERPDVEWAEVEFDLSEYNDEDEVVIRFVLTSDNSVAAPYGNIYLEDRSGVFIDNLLLEDGDGEVFLENNADDDPVPDELIPHIREGWGGDFWERTDESSHSGNWSMWNDDDHFFLMDAIDSPPFEIDEGFNVWMQFWVWCDLPDFDSDGNNALEDFYQIYISDDEGETWTYVTHDYARDVSGGQGWTHYTQDVPFNGSLDLSAYAGETVQLRWLFRTDGDHGDGNGDGLFIDDIEVIGSNRQPFDAEMQNLHIPYPTTVGYPLPGMTVDLHNVGLRDMENISAYWGYVSDEDDRRFPIIPRPNIVADTFATLELSDYRDRRNPSWTPPEFSGNYTIWAKSSVGDDERNDNDSIAVEDVFVMPQGLFELGYDNRTIRYTHEFDHGSGAAVRFSLPDADPEVENEEYTLSAVRMQFNGEQDETATFTLHVFGAGEDENAPGADEIFSMDVDVPVDSCLPNFMTVPLGEFEEDLSGLNEADDFWIWIEVLRDDHWPEIIGDDLLRGEGRYFSFDGENAIPYNRDLMVHAFVALEEPDDVTGSNGIHPTEFALGEPYPNPFNNVTRIRFTLATAGRTSLVLYDLSGREVMRLVDGTLSAGMHTAVLNGQTLSSGVYILRLEAGDQTADRKVVLMK